MKMLDATCAKHITRRKWRQSQGERRLQERRRKSKYFVVTVVHSANSVEDQVEQAMLREGKQLYWETIKNRLTTVREGTQEQITDNRRIQEEIGDGARESQKRKKCRDPRKQDSNQSSSKQRWLGRCREGMREQVDELGTLRDICQSNNTATKTWAGKLRRR